MTSGSSTPGAKGEEELNTAFRIRSAIRAASVCDGLPARVRVGGEEVIGPGKGH
ncbi:hypothetical protein [Yinghuangia sp. YIM S10712]|uniref:hypothetical protein n=1 Tax=Yinghuangia sp. YIM S10712 TaxID=3436930 RepID=UPI003F537F8C